MSSNPGRDDANIGLPVSEQYFDGQALFDNAEGGVVESYDVYVFGGRRVFREFTPPYDPDLIED